jgi:hypothetical protein
MTEAVTRSRKQRRPIAVFLPIVLALATGSVIVTSGIAGGTSASPPLSTVSNEGIAPAPALLARDTEALRRMEHDAGVVSLLGIDEKRAYYRIEVTDGPSCYAAGPATPVDFTFGKIMCASDFPSPERPLLDFTVMHGTMSDGGMSDVRVALSEGIAADGIAEVAFTNAGGDMVAAADVRDNIYKASPPSGKAANLVALASDGKVLHSQPLGASEK